LRLDGLYSCRGGRILTVITSKPGSVPQFIYCLQIFTGANLILTKYLLGSKNPGNFAVGTQQLLSSRQSHLAGSSNGVVHAWKARYFSTFGCSVSDCSFLFCAARTSSIAGTVTDSSAAMVANAKVEAKNEETGVVFAQNTTSSGNYSFASLTPGSYTITVTWPASRRSRACTTY